MAQSPQKRIKSEEDVAAFQKSPAYVLITSYLERFCLSIKGVLDIGSDFDSGTRLLLDVLTRIRCCVDSTQLIAQPMRFGNKAFRDLHAWLAANAASLLSEVSNNDDNLIQELVPYLVDSFGNSVRIDFGTGHEAAFMMFLIILIEKKKLILSPQVILVVFKEYIHLVRHITTKFVMEPAGSHGVWGLDDYHHLPFLFGAAQLIGHEVDVCRPVNLLASCDALADRSLYAECINFIKLTKCKHASFHEVAPLLHDFSKMDNWSLVCYGLMQLYKAEVLSKRPITQHFYFGNTLQWIE